MDGSFHMFAPKYRGAIVAHMQELDFSTDVVGGSRDSCFQVLATSLSLLATDDAHTLDVVQRERDARGFKTWTVNNTGQFCLFFLAHSFLESWICSAS
jgi:autophagy-related protein 2